MIWVAMLLGAVMAISVGGIVYMAACPVDDDRPTVDDITARIDGECHPRPHGLMTSERAHWILQERIECDVQTCAEKRRAWQYLVDTGKIRPGRWAVR